MLKCLLCESLKIQTEDAVYRCLNCDLTFKNPKSFPSLDSEKSRYLEHNNVVEDQRYLTYLKKLLDKSEITQGKALDFGCGPVKGYEFLCKKIYPQIEVLSYDPVFYPTTLDDKFDLILCSEVLEHLHKPFESLDFILNLMNQNGILAISTQLSDNKNMSDWWYLRDHTHVVFYSKKTIRWISNHFSLKILRIENPYIILSK